MKNPPIKKHWLDSSLEVNTFHVLQCKDEIGWTIEKTSKALNRSVGSVCQDIMLSSWSRTHEKQLRRMGKNEALEFVRKKDRERRLVI